jgi:Zn-dependent protease with chaperone function
MLDWIVEGIIAIVTFVPALFVAEDSPNFMLIRAMFGLLLIVLVVYIIAMQPVRSAIVRYMGKASDLIVRKR